MVEDCMATSDPALHEGTLENMRRHFGVVASSQEVVATWNQIAKRRTASG